MKSYSKWMMALVGTVLMAGTVLAADAVNAGTVKSVNAERKEFVLTDAAGKDVTYKIGDNLIVNNNGKETKSDLNVGDTVQVCYEKGILTWTAHYILVQDGTSKTCELLRGAVKSYDAGKKQLGFTDDQGKEWTFATGDTKVRLNRTDTKMEDIKIGDKALAIVNKAADKVTLKSLMVERAK